MDRALRDTAGRCVPGRPVDFIFRFDTEARKQQEDRYDLNQLKTERWIPSQRLVGGVAQW